MKVKREVEFTICDFCDNDAAFECSVCGKDICYNHDLTLHVHFKETHEGYSVPEYDCFLHSTKIITHFCPDHLSNELKQKFNSVCTNKPKVDE